MRKRLGCLIVIYLFTVKSGIVSSQENFLKAYTGICSMLSDSESLSFKKAVFLTENAYYDNTLDEEVFNKSIDYYVLISKTIINSGNIIYSETDKDKANAQCAVFLLMTDTIPIETNTGLSVHLPFQYNHEDFAGQKDWTNMFVSKMINTHEGNCHSLPYLYKMIMDELGQESYLALAPNHIYIKVQNKRTGWYNIELTCADFPTDAWLMASGYIHLDAIRNGIYMEALTPEQSVSLCLIDLAQGYNVKYGLGDGSFVLKCCDTALTHFPNNINALLFKAETLSALYKQAQNEGIKQSLFERMNELYPKIHELGYRKMPKGMYENWLKSLNTDEINQRAKPVIFINK